MARRLTKVPSSPSPWGEEFFLILKEKAKSQLPRNGSGSETLKRTLDSGKSLRRRFGRFSILEEDFFHAVEFGDIPSVQRILAQNPDLDVSRQDLLGRTPLRLAVANEHLEVVELLMEKTPPDALYEAVLIAIVMGHEQIAEVLLKSPMYKEPQRDWKHNWGQESDDSPFSSDMTALILASQYNRYEVVQLLLMKGHRIEKPHQYYCTCKNCKDKLELDRLRFWKFRLEAYRGLSSEAYISLASRDPMYTAFQLGKELREVATIEKHFKMEYLKLADALSDYVVKLLDRVRGNAELETVLNKAKKSRQDDSNTEEDDYETMARLRMAIEYEEKKFVAHPTCQQKLVSIWYGDLGPYLERPKWFLRLPVIGGILLMYPILAAVYLVHPDGKIGRIVKTPCVKLIAQTICFVIFLVLVLFSSLSETPSSGSTLEDFELCFSTMNTSVNPHNIFVRANLPNRVFIVVSLFVLGLLLQECRQLYHEGVRLYFTSLYNVMDTLMMAGYIASFALKMLSFERVHDAVQFFKQADSCVAFNNNSRKANETFYWLNADRLYWDNLDPYIMSEALFAFANVFSFSRISSLLPANEHFGPMQISLARMTKDIVKFMFIFVMVFFAFLVGMVNIYWYYVITTRQKVEVPHHNFSDVEAELYFGDVINTFRTMYWALFGMGEVNVVELGSYNKSFTQDVGYILYGTFNIVMVIVILNMLIAMMTRSFEMIQRDSDIEWKFARSQLYMDYITKGNTLPAPLNIIPPPYLIYRGFSALCRNMCCYRSKKTQENIEIGERPPVIGKDASEPSPQIPCEHSLDTVDNSNVSFAENDEPKVGTYRPLEKEISSDVEDISPAHFSDSFDETLTDFRRISVTTKRYQNVMKGIIKRHIFKSEYEDMSTGVTMEELKQDISSFRYETLNSIRPTTSGGETQYLSRRMQVLESSAENTRISLEFMQEKIDTLLIRQAKQIGDITNSLENLLQEPKLTLRNRGRWSQVRSSVMEGNLNPETIPEGDEHEPDDNRGKSGSFYLDDENGDELKGSAGRSKKRSLQLDIPEKNEAFV